KQPKDVRVLVVGCTGYIGKFVTKELIRRGYNVVAFTREKAGIKGKLGKEDIQREQTWQHCKLPEAIAVQELAGADVRFGDVQSLDSIRTTAFKDKVDVVVSCLASRTGGKKDSWAIDYQATKNCLDVGREKGAAHFVLLSAICVQKPLLEFQRAKLKLEEELQIQLVKEGKPYVMFGDGTLASCKPISEQDLAAFIVDCVQQQDKILPIGGPGPAYNALQQAQLLFNITGKKENLFPVPVALMDGIIGILDFFAKFLPAQFEAVVKHCVYMVQDAAEFGRIGKYYAVESMLVLDPATQTYSESATPSYGQTTLEAFFRQAVKEGLKGQELGDQAVFGVNEQ
ncbi:NAD(P)-bd_dom domain-containing protein, partial [Haematococcus lacustris]